MTIKSKEKLKQALNESRYKISNVLHQYWLNDLIDTIYNDLGPADNTHMSWTGPYDPTKTYIPYSMVLDEGWLMVSNKETDERAAPQPNGVPEFTVPDVPVWDTDGTNVSVVYSGHTYTFNQSGWVRAIRIWVPEITANTNYKILLLDSTNPLVPLYTVISEPILQAAQWNTILLGNDVTREGRVLSLILTSVNSGSTTNVSGGWAYSGESKFVFPPPTGGWVRDKHDVLYFNKTDLDSTDRGSELLGVIPNSTIRIVQTNDTTNFWEYLVIGEVIDNGPYVTFPVTRIDNGSNIDELETTTVDIDIPVPSSTKYKELADYWPTNSPDWATVEGVLQYDGEPQVGIDDTAFGVDIQFQKASVPIDWDFASYF